MSTNTELARAEERLSPTIRARMDRVPLLTPDEESALFVQIGAAHRAAWAAVLTDGTITDAREDDSDWQALRAGQKAALAEAARVMALRGAVHAKKRRDAQAWWCAVERTRAALDALVERAVDSNLRMCVYMARKFHRSPLSFDDRVQAATMGCYRAVKSFEVGKGYRFSTFATHWIRHEIWRAEQDTADTIRIPVHMHETRRVITRAWSKLNTAAGGVPPTPEQVAAEARRPVKDIRKVARLPRAVSGHQPISTTDDKDITLFDLIADAANHDPLDAIEEGRIMEALAEAIRSLTPAVQTILRCRFGITEDGVGCETETLKAIGERFSVSRERIRQLEVAALSHLRVLVPALLTPPARRTVRQQILINQHPIAR